MDLFDVVRACARRWYVFLPLLLITVYFSYSAYSAVKPVYYSNAVIGLAPPNTRIDSAPPGTQIPRNGLLDIGGASLIANMTAIGLQQKSVVNRVVAAGGMPNYSAKLFPVPTTTPQIPLIFIEETAPDSEKASKTLQLVVEQAEVTLRTLQEQAQVPESQMVTVFPVSPPASPVEAIPSRTRSTIAIFAAGALASVLISVLVDAVLTRRKAKRSRAEATAESKPASPPEDGGSTEGTHTGESALEAR